MTGSGHSSDAVARQLARARELKIIGIAWATAAAAVEGMILAENPRLAQKSEVR